MIINQPGVGWTGKLEDFWPGERAPAPDIMPSREPITMTRRCMVYEKTRPVPSVPPIVDSYRGTIYKFEPRLMQNLNDVLYALFAIQDRDNPGGYPFHDAFWTRIRAAPGIWIERFFTMAIVAHAAAHPSDVAANHALNARVARVRAGSIVGQVRNAIDHVRSRAAIPSRGQVRTGITSPGSPTRCAVFHESVAIPGLDPVRDNHGDARFSCILRLARFRGTTCYKLFTTREAIDDGKYQLRDALFLVIPAAPGPRLDALLDMAAVMFLAAHPSDAEGRDGLAALVENVDLDVVAWIRQVIAGGLK
ncbi:MAG: hypothetical protein Q6353_014060 [Candidatus Sigynarchaeum springense]